MSALALADAFQVGCAESGLDPEEGPVVVGMSGGCDSTVLASLLVRSGFDLVAVHVNYGLRPEAAEEEQFVRAWCAEHTVPLHVVDQTGKPPESGLQAWARAVRYRAFGEVAEVESATSVALGHHADDQLETILMNLERGTGLAGLIGMQPRRALSPGDACGVARPLLQIPRSDLESAAKDEGWTWMQDASNETMDYTRNALRHELRAMPSDDYEAFRDAALGLSGRVAAMRLVLQAGLVELCHERGTLLPACEMDNLPEWLQGWILTEWLHRHAPDVPRRTSIAREVLSLRSGQVGRKTTFEQTTVWRERDGWVIEPATSSRTLTESVAVILPADGRPSHTRVGSGVLELTRMTVDTAHRTVLGSGGDCLTVDPARIEERLSIRPWQPGDRFRPLGLVGSKKLKAYLTDRKVPSSKRQDVYVLMDGERVVCVLGHTLDDRYRLRDTSTEALVICWRSALEQVASES